MATSAGTARSTASIDRDCLLEAQLNDIKLVGGYPVDDVLHREWMSPIRNGDGREAASEAIALASRR